MGNKRITDLTPIVKPTGLSVMPLVHQGATRQITLDNLFTYVDDNYFKSGKAPSISDNLGNNYNQFKVISGNFLVSGSNIVRINTGIFRVDNSGFFQNYLSGKNVYIDNLSVSGLNLSGGSVQGDLTVLGNLRVSGDLTTLSTDFEIEDKNITFASIPSGLFLNNSGLDGAGFTVKGSDSDKKITWYNTEVNQNLNPLFTGTWQVDQNFQVEKKLRTSGTATFDSGVYITNSNINNPLKFGPNINLFSSGAGSNILATDQNLYVEKDVFIQDDLFVRNNFDVSGNQIRLLGNVTLGNSSLNTITFLGGFVQDVKPVNDWVNDASSPFQSLGISTNRWKEVFAGRGYFHNSVNITGTLRVTGDAFVSGNTTIGDSSSDILLVDSTPTFRSPNVFIQNNLNITGNLNVTGSTVLGDSTADRITLNGYVNSDIDPETNNTRDLGMPNLRWNNTYFNNSFVNNNHVSGVLTVGGNTTIGGSTTITGDLNVTGNTSISGNATIYGSVVFGDAAASDTVNFANARINSNIEPNTDNVFNFGAANRRWASLRTTAVFVEAVGAAPGNLNVSGSTVLGDSTSDILTLNARINTDVVPSTSSSRSLGIASILWNNVFTNNLNVSGNTTFGDATSDRVTFNALVNSTIVPEANNTRDLGTNLLYWRNLFGTNIISNVVNSS